MEIILSYRKREGVDPAKYKKWQLEYGGEVTLADSIQIFVYCHTKTISDDKNVIVIPSGKVRYGAGENNTTIAIIS